MEETKQLFVQGIQALKERNYTEAENKLKELINQKRSSKEKTKAEIIYNSLLMRRECERLLAEVESEEG